MATRKLCTRANIYSIPDDSFRNLVNNEHKKHPKEFYYINMRDVLLRAHQMCGKSFKNLKQIELDDIVNLFGILLTDDDVKTFVSNLPDDVLSGNCPNIDANKGRVIASY